MNISIRVREGYGKEIQRTENLSDDDRDRLVSNTKNIEENLAVEFEIEQSVRNFGESMGIRFIEGDKIVNGTVYDFRMKGLSYSDEEDLVRALKLPIPITTRLVERTDNATFPFIVKNPESRRGREVYLITGPDMLTRLNEFLNSTSAYVPSLGGKVSFNPSFEAEKLVYQEYIETPSERFTTYRVTLGCTGEIFSCCMTYSGIKKTDRVTVESRPKESNWHKRDLLKLPDSPFFLNSPKVVSNKSAGGGWIVLDPLPTSKKANDEEKNILKAHGLDPNNPMSPQLIKEASVKIARYLGNHGKGLIFGIDWIQSKNGRFYYLETNICPAGGTYLYTHKGGEGTYVEAMSEMLIKILQSLK